jgi:Putative restriction endonuclease
MSPPTLAIGEHVSHAQTEQRVIIRFVSWTTYEHLLADLANQSSTRLTYDRGLLEIMCPLPEHEEWNRTIALLVEVLAEERRVDVRNFGSTTFRRADLARGFEPDSCFYIQHEADISGKSTIDLTVDPPPDLVRACRKTPLRVMGCLLPLLPLSRSYFCGSTCSYSFLLHLLVRTRSLMSLFRL